MAIVDERELALDHRIMSAVDALRERLRDSLDGLSSEQGRVSFSSQNIAEIDQTIRMLDQMFAAAGRQELVNMLRQSLEDVRSEALQRLAEKGLPQSMSGPTMRSTQALLSSSVSAVSSLFDQSQKQIESYLSAAMIGGVRDRELFDQIERQLGTLRGYAQTHVATALHSMHSMIMVRHAMDNDIEWFAYRGPKDSITREWCGHWVNRVGTREMFESTDDKWGRRDQPDPVMVWRGGWNCRHRFEPIVGDLPDKRRRGPR
jgi:hypothetical protein